MTTSAPPRWTQYVAVTEVLPANRNPKAHDLDLVRASIARFGFVVGAVHDGRTGRIIAGHGRLEALGIMQDAGETPPDGIVADDSGWRMPVQMGWSSRSDAEAEALLVVLNKATEAGGWNDLELAQLLADLQVEAPELVGLTGFTGEELDGLIDSLTPDPEPEGDPDDTPDLPPEPRTQLGDLWLLGDHRVVCGDSTDEATLDRLLAGGQAGLLWTDPPYGIDYIGGVSHDSKYQDRRLRDGMTLTNDALSPDDLESLLRRAFTAALPRTAPGACWYVAAPPGPKFAAFAVVLRDLDVWRQTLVWEKSAFVLGRSDYHYRHEAMFYGWTPGGTHRAPPNRTQDSIWLFDRPSAKDNPGHPTAKPVGLVQRALENSSALGWTVLDLFGGSGSTLIAAELTRRHARLVELDPKYVDVICLRWQTLTGRLPVLERTGEPVDFTKPLEAAA